MLPIRVVFDLDDTLYLERDFARSGFIAAGDWLRQELGIEGLAETCHRIFATGHRSHIFNKAVEFLRVEADPALVELLVDIYRTHEPAIALTADAARYLARRSEDFPVGLVTDGPSGIQQAKVRALGLERALDFIVYTDALGGCYSKPHPRAFELVEAWAAPFGLPLAYVADNPLKDFVTPRARGWWTVQMERPERANHFEAPSAAYEAHARIASLDELDSCLDGLQAASGRKHAPGHSHVDALVGSR